MTDSNVPQINLQTLVSAIQNSVQALNGIATRIVSLTTAISTAFPPPLTSSAIWDPPSLASGASELTTVTVTGAVLGKIARASFSLDLQGMSLSAYVSAANTVTVVLSNLTGGTLNLASGTLLVSVGAY